MSPERLISLALLVMGAVMIRAAMGFPCSTCSPVLGAAGWILFTTGVVVAPGPEGPPPTLKP